MTKIKNQLDRRQGGKAEGRGERLEMFPLSVQLTPLPSARGFPEEGQYPGPRGSTKIDQQRTDGLQAGEGHTSVSAQLTSNNFHLEGMPL